MALGLPIVAVAAGAIPETGGAAGLYFPCDPAHLAAGLYETVQNGNTRESQIRSGYERYQEFYTDAAIGRRFLALFEKLTGGGPRAG